MIFRTILGIVSLIAFFLVGMLFVQLGLLLLAIILLPYQLVIILPLVLIYDTVFVAGDGKPVFTIAFLTLFVIFHLLKPYLRKHN